MHQCGQAHRRHCHCHCRKNTTKKHRAFRQASTTSATGADAEALLAWGGGVSATGALQAMLLDASAGVNAAGTSGPGTCVHHTHWRPRPQPEKHLTTLSQFTCKASVEVQGAFSSAAASTSAMASAAAPGAAAAAKAVLALSPSPRAPVGPAAALSHMSFSDKSLYTVCAGSGGGGGGCRGGSGSNIAFGEAFSHSSEEHIVSN